MMMTMTLTHEKPYYEDRLDAGRRLAEKLAAYHGNCLVFGVANGGLPVAAEVAALLEVDMDTVIALKLPVPFDRESGYGAVAGDGVVVYNKPMMKRLGISDREAQKQADRIRRDVDRRVAFLRGEMTFPWLVGKVAVIVDDGMASGYTMAAAVKAIRNHRAGKVVVAAPIASYSAYQIVKTFADEVVCPIVSRSSWFTVPASYENCARMADQEARSVLRRCQGYREKPLPALAAAR